MKNYQKWNIGLVLMIALVLPAMPMVIAMKQCDVSSPATIVQTTNLNTVGDPDRNLIWDNYGPDSAPGVLSSQIDYVVPFNSQGADDFKFASENQITGVHWWGDYWSGSVVNPSTFNILFYADDGTGNEPTGAGMNDPSPTALKIYTIPDVYGIVSGNFYEYNVTLPEPFQAAANTKYWIAIQWNNSSPPQWGWAPNGNNPVQLHVGVTGFPAQGIPYWWQHPGSHGFRDLAFQLYGGGSHDTTPPVTTCRLDGVMSGGVYISDVNVTLTATDTESGVNYTKYQVDSGGWITYSNPFVVTANGTHVVSYYSVDNAGNIETIQTSNFTIQHQSVSIEISVKGGFGVSAVIKNTGSTTITNIQWKIKLTGGLIFIGRSQNDIIGSLAPGASTPVKDVVFGFGKTTIDVTAGNAQKTVTGMVLLFLVLGIK
jgi:hypothetical protein